MTVEALCLQFGDKGLLFIAFMRICYKNQLISIRDGMYLSSYGGDYISGWDVLSVLEFMLYGLKLIKDGKSIEQ